MASEFVEFLCFECNTDHKHFPIIHVSYLLNRSVVKATSVPDSVTVFHEAHKWDYQNLWVYLRLVLRWLKNIEELARFQYITIVVLSKYKRFALSDNNRQTVGIVSMVILTEKSAHNRRDIHFVLDWHI